ncbi:MAG: recombinase family protein [Phycisphaerales bacterium]|nr:MAG: recombinase family protein [Phycisphaerales bacterium]
MARAGTVNRPRGGKVRALRAVGYVRRSTDRQEQSIPDQKKAIEQYVDEHGMRLVRFYVDDAASGTSTVGRRAFQALITDAKRRGCDFTIVVVYDVKRFGRIDNDEAGYYRHVLRTHGVEVRYVSENFSGDGTDDLLRPVKQWQAREESKDLAKVAIRGLLSRATFGSSNGRLTSGERNLGGWWMGGAPPFGYDLGYESQSGQFLFHLRYMRDGTKQMFDKKWMLTRTLERGESIAVSRKDRCRLVLSEKSRVQTIRRIFREYVQERRGFKAIADSLNRDGVPTSRGSEWAAQYGGRWSLTSVRAILINPAYAGDLVWNRRTDARFFRIADGRAVERVGVHGRRLEPNDESDWIVTRDAHPAIVSRRIWEAAKTRLEEEPASKRQRGINPRTGEEAGKRTGGWTGPKAKFLLSGLCTCSRCGSRYEGLTRYGNRSTDGERRRTLHYGCGGYIRHGRHCCTLGALPKDGLEEAVITSLVEFYGRYAGEDAEKRIAEVVGLQIDGDRDRISKRRKSLKAKLIRVDKTTRNLLDNITKANRDLVDQRLAELTKEREQLETKIESLDHLTLTEAEVGDLDADTRRFVACLGPSLREGPLDQRQAAARRCIDGIVIDRRKGEARIQVRVLPTIAGSQAGLETEVIHAALPEVRRGRPRGNTARNRKA